MCKTKPLFLMLVFCLYAMMAQGQTRSLIYQIYQAKNGLDVFGRIDSLKTLKKNNIRLGIKSLSESVKTQLIKNADLAAAAPWALLTLSDFNEFKLNGNRVNYENKYFSRRNKLNTLIIGELVANDHRYLTEIINGLGLICEESTWALPAHMSMQRAGNGLPDVNDPIIDLFVGQTAALLANVKFLLADEMAGYSPLLVQRMDSELKKRVFDPYLGREDLWWMGFNTTRKMNNWNVFINANVLNCVILAEENPERRRMMVEKSMKSIDRFLDTYPADGGCDEGPSYWGMAGGSLIEYIDLLSVYSGGQLDFSSTELIHQIGTYIYKVHIDRNYYVNFADAAVATVQDAVKIYKFGRLFQDEKLLNFAAYLRKMNNGTDSFDLGSVNGFINSLELKEAWTAIKVSAPQLKSAWLKDLQLLTARQEQGSPNGLFFAGKGGNNGESHNHNDVGNFVVYKDGTPIVVDAGVGVYTRQTFSSDRYRLWYMQSDWHSCPTINGVMQQAGGSFKAESVISETNNELTKLSMDIGAAYPKEAGINFWKRKFIFNHHTGFLRLTEDYSLKMFKQAFKLNFLINGTVTEIKHGQLKLTNALGKSISLNYDPAKFEYEIERKEINDPRLAASWPNALHRLILKVKGTQLTGNYTIEFVN